VVVVGGASETETVLKAVFERRGATVERRRRGSGDDPATAASPQVIVIDLDAESEDSAPGHWQQAYRVLIGSNLPQTMAAGERFLAKPFHYPELVQVIEDLLDGSHAA
jgi:CheY-like chemotaxis protein